MIKKEINKNSNNVILSSHLPKATLFNSKLIYAINTLNTRYNRNIVAFGDPNNKIQNSSVDSSKHDNKNS